MTTEWDNTCLIISTDLEMARDLAVMAAPFPWEAEAERNNFPDTPNLTPDAWFCIVQVKDSFAKFITWMQKGGDSPELLKYLESRGFDKAMIPSILSKMTFVIGEALDVEAELKKLGYEIVKMEDPLESVEENNK